MLHSNDMKSDKTILVTKFGGAAIKNLENFGRVAEIVLSRKKEYDVVIVVISAMWQMTDQLSELASKVSSKPSGREHDMLLTVGERISMSLLAMVMEDMGQNAASFTGSQAGIVTNCEHSDAKIVDVKPKRLFPHLDGSKFVVVAGFQGVSVAGDITTLGRGGSDTTAVALATALAAEKVEFYKDVDGIFEADPKCCPDAKHIPHLSYCEALKVIKGCEKKVLHPRALKMARDNAIPLEILSFEKEGKKSIVVAEDKMRPEVPIFEVEKGLVPR